MNLQNGPEVDKLKKKKNLLSSIPKNPKGLFQKILLSEYFVLYLSITYFLALAIFIPELASFTNMRNVLSNVWPLFAIAIGQTVVLILAGIDLSQTSIMAFTSVIGAVVMTKAADPNVLSKSPLWGWFLTENGGPLSGSSAAVPVAIVAMLIFGAIVGFINGFAIAKFKMPPFMVTLVSQMFFSAFAIFITKSENVMNLPDSYIAIGHSGIAILPFSLLIAALLGTVTHIFLSRTIYGHWLYATGTNIKTALVSGIPTNKVIIAAYAFSGFCAAVSAILYSARLEMGRPTMGASLLMDIVGATVIGGTSMFGGKGKVVWTLFGVFFFALLSNTLNLLNLSYFTINIVKGTVILLAALADVTRTRIMARQFTVEKVGE
jgi:ribose/xylose/arabinose/galactoside ABC-type transport system permease subunit